MDSEIKSGFRRRYILALALVGMLATGTLLLIQNMLSLQENDTRLINIAGAQRMLSQRIALDIQRVSNQYDSERVEMLARSLQAFYRNHETLLGTIPEYGINQRQHFSPTLNQLMFGFNDLNNRILALYDTGNSMILGRPFNSNEQQLLLPTNLDDLLYDLDLFVSQLEKESRDRIEYLNNLELFLWIFLMLTLVLEGLFIFRPMERKIIESLSVEKEKNSEMKVLLDKANQAVEAKDMFLATMSHELRTPLNGINGMLQLLMNTGLNPKQEKYVDMATTSTHALTTLLNDILDLSRMNNNELELFREPFNVVTELQVIADAISISCREKGLGLITEFEQVKQLTVTGDAPRFKQVILNLAGNGVKFTENGDITLSAKVESEKEQRILRVDVKDTGMGIDPVKLGRLFKSFTQGDSSHNRGYGGSGIGLTISAKLATLMEGELRVSSEVGKGSIFTLLLPIDEGH